MFTAHEYCTSTVHTKCHILLKMSAGLGTALEIVETVVKLLLKYQKHAIIAVKHLALGGRESLKTGVKYFFKYCTVEQKVNWFDMPMDCAFVGHNYST